MPDKEFDKLFKDKFADAEIEPSANLWANIEKQLEPKRKRVFPIYWMAAASVVIAISAMLVFQKTDKIKLRGTEQTAIVVKPTVEQDVIETNAATVSVLTVKPVNVNERSTASAKIKAPIGKTEENKTPEVNLKNIQYPVQPITASNRLPIKQQDVKPLDVAPIKEAQVENPIVIASVGTADHVEENAISESGTERKGIRNVGDLVNFVVDKVDKREKKFVKFNTDDDDNSSIVGINIGFLKFNKKNK